MLTRTASNESNQTISAALRRGFHSHTAGPSSAALNSSSFSISGSTPLRDGRQLHHSIRLVDEDSDNEADDSDENSTPTGNRTALCAYIISITASHPVTVNALQAWKARTTGRSSSTWRASEWAV